MTIFGIVSPALVGVFLIVSLMAAVVHHLAGSHQKITMTFLALVAVTLWVGNEPWAEPFPGAIKIIVVLATVFQIVMAGLAYWVRDPKPKV
ncbi:TPA: hypothetical protein ACIRVE_005089 [Pseudomonas putida]